MFHSQVDKEPNKLTFYIIMDSYKPQRINIISTGGLYESLHYT